jgi:hypothetical protein
MTDFYFNNVVTAYLIYVMDNSLVGYGTKFNNCGKKGSKVRLW